MSRICSPVKKINELVIHPIPAGKATPVVKAIKVEGMFFVVGLDGKIYNNTIADRCYLLHRWHFVGTLLRALNRLGVITRSEMRQHLEACTAAEKQSSLQVKIQGFNSACKKLGLIPSSNQVRAIRKLQSK